MPPLVCVGKDGVERTFAYTYMPAELDGPHTFFVASDPLPASGNRFEMGLVELDGDSVRVTIAKHYDEVAYASKGIPEALIPVAARVLNKNIQSSPGVGAETDIYRLKRATDYWKRTSGATYDEGTDIYTFARPTPSDVAVPGVPPEPDDAKAHEVGPEAI